MRMAGWAGFFGSSLSISSHRTTKGKAVSSRTSTPLCIFPFPTPSASGPSPSQ